MCDSNEGTEWPRSEHLHVLLSQSHPLPPLPSALRPPPQLLEPHLAPQMRLESLLPTSELLHRQLLRLQLSGFQNSLTVCLLHQLTADSEFYVLSLFLNFPMVLSVSPWPSLCPSVCLSTAPCYTHYVHLFPGCYQDSSLSGIPPRLQGCGSVTSSPSDQLCLC